MNNRQSRSHDLLRHVLQFLTGNERLRASPRVDAIRLELQVVKDTIDRLAVEQNRAAAGRGTDGRRVAQARDSLRLKHLKPLVRDGKHILFGLPGIRDDLRLPHKLATAQEHIQSAKHVRSVIAPHAPAFIARQHPRDFLEQLDDAIRELEAAAAVDRGAGRARLSVVTREVRELFAEARLIVDRLHATIHAEFADHKLLLLGWDHVNRVPARLGRPPKRRRRAASLAGAGE